MRGTKSVVPNKSNRKQPFSFDRNSYKQRHRIENAFCRLKDFRRIATRYDLARSKLPCFRLPYRRYRMVDLMSPDPSFLLDDIDQPILRPPADAKEIDAIGLNPLAFTAPVDFDQPRLEGLGSELLPILRLNQRPDRSRQRRTGRAGFGLSGFAKPSPRTSSATREEDAGSRDSQRGARTRHRFKRTTAAATVIGNVRTLVAFRIGGRDAKLLAPEFRPMDEGALTDLARFEAWLRRGVGRYRVATEPKSLPPVGTPKAVRRQSAQRFGQSGGSIELESSSHF